MKTYLVESDVLLETGRSDSVQQSEGTETVDVSSVLGELERDLDVRLGPEIVDLGRLQGDVSTSIDTKGFRKVKVRRTRTWEMM